MLTASPAAATAVAQPRDDLARRTSELFSSADQHHMWILSGFLEDALQLIDARTQGLRDEIASRDRPDRDLACEALWH